MFEETCSQFEDATEEMDEMEARIYQKHEVDLSSFQMRPEFSQRFRALTVKELIQSVMSDELTGKTYTSTDAEIWSKKIATDVRNKVKELGFKRYKFMVHVVLGERHGAGVKIGSRCLWDADTDNYASDVFLNETIFCMTVVYAVYFY